MVEIPQIINVDALFEAFLLFIEKPIGFGLVVLLAVILLHNFVDWLLMCEDLREEKRLAAKSAASLDAKYRKQEQWREYKEKRLRDGAIEAAEIAAREERARLKAADILDDEEIAYRENLAWQEEFDNYTGRRKVRGLG